MLNNRLEFERMASVELDHWWYRTLHLLVLNALAKHTCGLEARIVDAGCGTGGLMLYLQQRGYTRLQGFDLSHDAVVRCRVRGLQVCQQDLRDIEQVTEVDAVISNDTLYHLTVSEQMIVVEKCWKLLAPGGLLIINLPALGAFQGIHDLSVGIRTRCSLVDTPRLLDPGRFELIEARYWPFWLSLPIYAIRLSQRLRMRFSAEFVVKSDIALPPKRLNSILALFTALEIRTLPWTPFGSSLFLVGKKKKCAPSDTSEYA